MNEDLLCWDYIWLY